MQETLNRASRPAITSDHWHVVLAKWSDDRPGELPFIRAIVSEHDDRAHAIVAAKALVKTVAVDEASRPASDRDEVFVRRPNFKSLKFAKRRRPARD